MAAEPHSSDGYPAVPQVVSREADNLVVLYSDSNNQTWNALAFKINQINRRVQRITNLPRLGPGEALDFGFMGEDGHSADTSTPGLDQLRIEDDRVETIAEYGIAVKPDGVLAGVQNPADENITGIVDSDRLRGYGPNESNASDFEDFGSLRSEATYTGAKVPTTALSETPNQGIIRFDKTENDRNNVYVGFLNQRENDAALEVLVQGVTYKVTPVTDPAITEDMFFGDGYRRRVVTYGGLDNSSPKRPRDWVAGETEITGGDVRAQLNGGEN